MNGERKPLAPIVIGNGGNDDIFDRFETAEAADDFGPLPKGTYVAVAVSGEWIETKTAKKAYKIGFRVLEGDYVNRRLWRPWYFTDAALPLTKRDLSKFGITGKAQLQQPFPKDRFVVRLHVTIEAQDDGTQRNEIKSVDVIRVQEPEANPFAPDDAKSEGGNA